MVATAEYYQQILLITQDYLGPAAGRFLNRQISLYLGKSPQQLNKSDVQMLAIRIRSGLVVLTKDPASVEEAYRRISTLVDYQD